MPSYRCTVNEVGPAVDGTETASPVVYINLTDTKGSFANTWFYAADGAQDQMLDVAIAAINNDNAVDVVAAAPNAGGRPYTKIARIHELQTLPPAAPTNFHLIEIQPALSPSQRQLLVGWNDNSDNEDGFELVFQQQPNGSPGEYTVGQNSTKGYMVLDGGHDYTIYAIAFNRAGNSAPSNSIVVTVPVHRCGRHSLCGRKPLVRQFCPLDHREQFRKQRASCHCSCVVRGWERVRSISNPSDRQQPRLV